MRLLAVVLAILITAPTLAQPILGKKALLIGIDDYSASTLPRHDDAGLERTREWPDLKGAVNDVEILREMLVRLYGFRSADVVTLKDQQATRVAILQSLDRHLIQSATEGSVAFFYYAGHGGQVPNPASDEPDRLDESIVPADSRRGAPDIRDKELRPLFNKILDRGAHLTLLLDHCHSGSGFRGRTNSARPRGIARAALIRDARQYGPRPEERGALVFASAQDLDEAWETLGDDGLMHGSFTWAFIRSMRDAVAAEPAQETFLRAQARMRHETPFQSPVMLGSREARLRPFLGDRADRRDGDRTVVAVERVDGDGNVVLQGGWAHGLSVGSVLRVAGDRTGARLRITAMLGLGRSVARASAGQVLPRSVRSGALLEVVAWAVASGRPLRVYIPHSAAGTLRKALSVGPAMHEYGIVLVDDARIADYALTRRNSGGRAEYAWTRPFVRDPDPVSGALPVRTAWFEASSDATLGDAAARLRRALFTLRRIHAWHRLESPSDTRAPYSLALQREPSNELLRAATVTGGETYSVVLRATRPLTMHTTPRYYYVFVVDSAGKSHLVYPRAGSVENRFPIANPAPPEIRLGQPSAFRIMAPYGTDTYFLLSTEEPLANPSILEWDGVRSPVWTRPPTPLETLLWLTASGTRASRTLTTSRWSIERIAIESVPPPRVMRRAAAF